MTDLITKIPDIFGEPISDTAEKLANIMSLHKVENTVNDNLSSKKVYSYPSSSDMPTAAADKATVKAWAQYMKEKYSNTLSTGTYTIDSDKIFNKDMYNSLCNNAQTLYYAYLHKGGAINNDFTIFEAIYEVVEQNFIDYINTALDNINSIFNQNACLNFDGKKVFQIEKNTDTTLKASSPALVSTGHADISYVIPSKLVQLHKQYKTQNDCTINVMQEGADPTVNATNVKVHRIREVTE